MSNSVFNKKKGQIVLGFLVKMLITILIIFSSVAMIGKIFSVLVDQSGDNFVDFVSDMNYVSDHGDGYKMNSLLIMDEDSALVYFEGKNAVKLEMFFYGDYQPITYTFSKPESCSDDLKSCICLMQTISGEKDKQNYDIKSGKTRCINLDYIVSFPSCSTYEETNKFNLDYRCYEGFVIDRNLPEAVMNKVQIRNQPYFFTERRQNFLFVNNKNNIEIISSENQVFIPAVEELEYDHDGGWG